jgi:hypothetical protein
MIKHVDKKVLTHKLMDIDKNLILCSNHILNMLIQANK